MRRCVPKEELSLLWRREYSALSQAPSPQSKAIQRLSNAELLKLVQNVNRDTTLTTDNEPGADRKQDDDVPAQSSIPKLTHPPLPRSPLTEPRLVAARARHRREKPPASKDRSPFQLKLQKSPYAQALSTPPRLCLLTGIRLPSYFLIPFGIAKHPKTGAPWHLPRLSKLANKSGATTTPPAPPSSPNPTTDSNPNQSIRTATGTHFVATYEALAHISKMNRPAYRRLMPHRWKEDTSLKVQEIVWREDMADFVLEMLRKSIARDLEYLASKPAAYIVDCKSYDDISSHKQVAAILWLGSSSDQSAPGTSMEDANKEGEPPPAYAMRCYKGRYIPLFDLVTLLGRAHLLRLREVCPAHIVGQLALVKAKRPTMKFQLELWQLVGFLGQSSEGKERKDEASNELT